MKTKKKTFKYIRPKAHCWKSKIKYLGVILDQFLMFQEKIKMILRNLAREISTLQSIKYPLQSKIAYYS